MRGEELDISQYAKATQCRPSDRVSLVMLYASNAPSYHTVSQDGNGSPKVLLTQDSNVVVHGCDSDKNRDADTVCRQYTDMHILCFTHSSKLT